MGFVLPRMRWRKVFSQRVVVEPAESDTGRSENADSLDTMTASPSYAHDGHAARPGHGPAPDDDTGLAEMLDLDAVLGAPVLAVALDAASEALSAEPGCIVDLGAGTGTGSLALADRFPGARIHSLDASSGMLDRLRNAAAAAGVGERIEPHLIDLDGDWPAVLSRTVESGGVERGGVESGSVELAWAALSLHHVSRPERVLQQVMHVLRPGGVLVVIEMTGETAFDPDDLGTGNHNLADRVVGALATRGYPVTGEWTQALADAGFSPVQRIDTALTASAHTEEGAHYLEVNLSRNRGMLGAEADAAPHGRAHHGATGRSDGGDNMESLSTKDLAALDVAVADLKSGASNLTFSSGRAIWIAVRP